MAKLLYFGRLAEAVGRADQDLQLGRDMRMAGDLRRLHPALAGPHVKVVINKSVARDDAPVTDDDEIAFLPPVSGG